MSGQTCGRVEMADGHTSKQQAVLSRRLNLRIGGHVERTRFTTTELKSNYDLLLGIPWLMDHDPAVGWADRSLHFGCGGREMVVRGEQLCTVKEAARRPSIQMVSLSKVLRDCKKASTEAVLFLIREARESTSRSKAAGHGSPALVNLLKEYADVLVDGLPPGLPPQRNIDHDRVGVRGNQTPASAILPHVAVRAGRVKEACGGLPSRGLHQALGVPIWDAHFVCPEEERKTQYVH